MDHMHKNNYLRARLSENNIFVFSNCLFVYAKIWLKFVFKLVNV